MQALICKLFSSSTSTGSQRKKGRDRGHLLAPLGREGRGERGDVRGRRRGVSVAGEGRAPGAGRGGERRARSEVVPRRRTVAQPQVGGGKESR